MKRLIIISATALLALFGTTLKAQEQKTKPKLIVNIVVSQMRYDYMSRFSENFSPNGFRSFMETGTFYRNAHHNYMQTNTVAGLATISTGANPSEHGIISQNWIDFTTNNTINLIYDSSAAGLECDAGIGNYSPRQLIAATIGDRLKESDEKSKVISLAMSPYSAITVGGYSADTYWIDQTRGGWISSSFYFNELPVWVTKYNDIKTQDQFFSLEWIPARTIDSYKNSEVTILSFDKQRGGGRQHIRKMLPKDDKIYDATETFYTPYGNTMTTIFAREAIIQEHLGKDDHTDLLTVVYDGSRYVSELFGPRSIEVEDMYYRLDAEIGELVNFIFAQTEKREDVVIMLTSDHGASDTYKERSRIPMGRFNTVQFRMIMNGFLSAQYEQGLWVTDYSDRQLYLNRELIYSYGYNLDEIQERAAAFALQFSGVAGAITSSSMQSGYFGKGYTEKVQNGFYPKRSGDITINLMPGWTEDAVGKISSSGSLYEYDTHVPLMFLGGDFGAAKIDRNVDMRSVAPTLSRIMQITIPNASSGEVLRELVGQ